MRPPRGVLRIKSSRIGPPRLIFTPDGPASQASKGEARQLLTKPATAFRAFLESSPAPSLPSPAPLLGPMTRESRNTSVTQS